MKKKLFWLCIFSVKYTIPIIHNINLLKAILITEDLRHSTVFLVLTFGRIIGWLDVSGETCCLSILRVTEFASGGCRFQLSFTYRNLQWRRLPRDSDYLVFSHIFLFHSIFRFQLAPFLL
jgi:hypothetical protein